MGIFFSGCSGFGARGERGNDLLERERFSFSNNTYRRRKKDLILIASSWHI